MRGSLLVLLMGTVWSAGGSPGQAAERAPAPNLVPNGGFEADTAKPGFPDAWTFNIRAEDTLLRAELSADAHSGRRSFCVTKGPGRRAMPQPSPVLVSTPLELKPRVTYAITFWAKMESAFPLDTFAFRVKTNTPGFRGQRPFHFDVGREWQQYTIDFLTEADTTTGTAEFFDLGDLADRLFIDDVAIRETGAKADPNLPLCYHPWLPPPKTIYRADLDNFDFPRDRPRVERTAAEIAEMKQGMAGRDIGEHPWVREAGPWLERPLHFFEQGSSYAPTGTTCPVHGTGLTAVVEADGTYGMRCPQCNKLYTTEAHQSTAREQITKQHASGARTLARAYALSGDERYARRSAEILLGFAQRYRKWGGGTRATMYVLHECHSFLVQCATAYDYIYNSPALSAADHRQIEEEFLRPAAQFYSTFADGNGRMNNRGAIYNHAALTIGAAISAKEFVDHALNSPYSGFHPMVAALFDGDGLTPEGFGYQTYTMTGLIPIAETAYRLGVNPYRDPAYRRLWEATYQVLLPGEEALRGDYEVACRRFAEVGNPMEYPFGADKVERATRRSSVNFRQRGYAILRSGADIDHTSLSMTYGNEAMWYGHELNRAFSLVLYANGRLLTPRGRAPSYGHALGGWSETALGNSALTVDDMDHQVGEDAWSTLVAYDAAPRVKLVRGTNDRVYRGVTLDRTLFLADGYVVDLMAARAQSGEHRFDLIYRLFGKLDCGLPLQARKGALGAGYGYEYLTDVRSARTGEGWTADWRQPGASALRLSVVGAPGTEVNACTAPVNADAGPDADADQKQTADAILARRRGRDTVFAAVWEPYRGQPMVTKAAALPVEGGDAQGAGVEVVQEGRPGSACFLASYAPGKRRFGDIELDGKVAAGRWRSAQAEPEYLHLAQGVLLRRGARSLEATAPATLYVERIAPDRVLVKTGSGSAGRLTLSRSPFGTGLPGPGTRLPVPVRVERDGQAVEHNERGGGITFEVAADASYRISGVTDWQSVRLASEGAAPLESAPGEALDLTVRPEPGTEGPLASDGTLTGKNKIANAGFEVNPKTHGDIATPWERRNSYYAARFGTPHTYDSETAHSGGCSLKIPGVQYYQATLRGLAEQRLAGPVAGKTYTFSAWVKASLAPTRARLVLYGWNPKWGRDFEGGVSPEFTIGTEWQRITWTRAFGPEITEGYAMVMRPYQTMGGAIWVDDVQVEEGARATDFAPDAWTERAQKKPAATARR
ncbi:MAG: alginate lyase family protein [Armatimonadetes bacterium]|nr:alginate lyase family protein [Armatimonadota bacterium]